MNSVETFGAMKRQLLEEVKEEVKAALLVELQAEARYKVSVETQDASKELKLDRAELKAEVMKEVMEQLRNKSVIQTKPKFYYGIIKEMVNKRFARTDTKAVCNPTAVMAFSSMVKDVFALARIYDLDEENGEKAVAMTKEIIAVCDKYAPKGGVVDEQVGIH